MSHAHTCPVCHVYHVTEAEAGQKLVQYLVRRLHIPHSVLHRWIRTGQIRVNSGRRKPFDRVEAGDSVRLPPFVSLPVSSIFPDSQIVPLPPIQDIPILYADNDLLICRKPLGLPVHGGTGHSDSLTARLHTAFANAPFAPTPAHRLDKDTSGLICVARSYTRLRALHEALYAGICVKEYLAWVEGHWLHSTPHLLENRLSKRYVGADEKMRPAGMDTQGKDSRCMAVCLERVHDVHGVRSLLHLSLLTGRTHQLRVQCAALGYPVCGDVKYGASQPGVLRLHAARLMLPHGLGPADITCLPDWEGAYAVETMPAPFAGVHANNAPAVRHTP